MKWDAERCRCSSPVDAAAAPLRRRQAEAAAQLTPERERRMTSSGPHETRKNQLHRILRILDIPFDFPASTRDFMQYLDDGASRYLEYSFSVTTKTLVALDRTVWFLRRYCEYIRGTTHDINGHVVDRLQREIQWPRPCLENSRPSFGKQDRRATCKTRGSRSRRPAIRPGSRPPAAV